MTHCVAVFTPLTRVSCNLVVLTLLPLPPPLLPPPPPRPCTLLHFACAASRPRARTLEARPYAMERGRARLKASAPSCVDVSQILKSEGGRNVEFSGREAQRGIGARHNCSHLQRPGELFPPTPPRPRPGVVGENSSDSGSRPVRTSAWRWSCRQ